MSGGINAAHSVTDTDPWADANAQDTAILALQASAAAFNENVDDRVGALVVPGDGASVVYDDNLGTLTVGLVAGAGSTYVQDGGGLTYSNPTGEPTIFIGTADPASVASPWDSWKCPGVGEFVRNSDNTTWLTVATYDILKDPYAGGGGGGGGGGTGIQVADPSAHLTQGSSGSFTLTATGASGSYTWTITTLPTGLSLSGNTVSGTPTVSGTFSVTATATAVTSGGAFTSCSQIGSGGRNAAGTAAIPITMTGSGAAVAVGGIVNVEVGASVISSLNANWTATDNLGNTYLNDVSQLQGTSAQTAILSSRVSAAGTLTTVTITPGNSASNVTAIVSYAVGVLATGTYLDKFTSAGGTGTAVSSGNTATTTGTTDLVIGANATFNTAGAVTKGTGFTQLGTYTSTSGTNDRTLQAQYQIMSANAAVASTETTATSGTWSSCVATYKPGTGTVSGGGATGSKTFNIIIDTSGSTGSPGTYALLGVNSVNGKAGDQDNGTPGFTSMKSDLGSWLHYAHFYIPGGPPRDWTSTGAYTVNAGLGTVPVITMTNTSVANIMSGYFDSDYTAFFGTLPNNAVVAFQHEPNTKNAAGDIKFSYVDYQTTFNRIAALCKAANSNIKVCAQYVALNITQGYPYALGDTGLNYRGAYSASTAYAVKDTVKYLNLLYRATAAHAANDGIPPVAAANGTANSGWATGGLNYSNIDYWGLDCYPSNGQTLKARMGARGGYLQAMYNIPLVFTESGYVNDRTGPGPEQNGHVVESLKFCASIGAPFYLYFVGQDGHTPYDLTNAQWKAVKTALDAGN